MLEKIKEENPKLYQEVLHMVMQLESLPKKQRRAAQRKILKMISNKNKSSN